jgi:hypothetical protein
LWKTKARILGCWNNKFDVSLSFVKSTVISKITLTI